MPLSATKIRPLENLSLEDLLKELLHYRPASWKPSQEKDYSLQEIPSKKEKDLPVMKESWKEYCLKRSSYHLVIRKEIVKNRYPLYLHFPKRGYIYSDIPKAFQLKVLLNNEEVSLFEEGIDSRTYRVYRRLESLFDRLENN